MEARIVLLAVTLVLACVACGSEDEPSTAGSDPPAEAACTGTPRPVSVEMLVKHLNEAGFSVTPDTEPPFCDPVSAGREDQILASVGGDNAACTLYRGSLYGDNPRKDLDADPASPIFSGRKAQFLLENLSCVIYPDQDDPEGQIERFNAAMVQLEPRLSP